MVAVKTGAKITVSAGIPMLFRNRFRSRTGVLSLVGRNTNLDGVANALQSNILDKPVVNQTGLTGRYDFLLKFTPDVSQVANFGGIAPGNAGDLDAPPISSRRSSNTRIETESTKAFVDVIVIEKIERPSRTKRVASEECRVAT